MQSMGWITCIEAGVLLDNAFVAQSLREQFESLAQSGVLQPVPG